MPAQANRFEAFSLDEMRALYLGLRFFRDVPEAAKLHDELLPAMNARQNEELRLPGWSGVTVCAECRWQWRGPVADHKPGCSVAQLVK